MINKIYNDSKQNKNIKFLFIYKIKCFDIQIDYNFYIIFFVIQLMMFQIPMYIYINRQLYAQVKYSNLIIHYIGKKLQKY